MESNINRDKLSDYAESVADKLCHKFFSEGKHITGPEILKFSDLEQLNLLILKNLYVKWNEESRALKSPYFDYDSDNVKKAMAVFLNVLSKNISVGKDAFHPVLTTAIEELFILVSDFKAYMQHYIVDKNINAELVEGTAKFYKIHARPFRLSSSMLVKSRHPEVSSIPVSFLPEDKDQKQANQSVSSYLEQIVPIDPKIFLQNEAYANDTGAKKSFDNKTGGALISRPQKPIIPREEQRSASSHKPIETSTPTESEAGNDTSESESDFIAHNASENEKPLAKDIVNENQESEIDMLSFDRVEEDTKDATSERTVLNDRFSEQKESLADRHRSLNGESIRSAISLNQKFMFINQLFKGNSEEFEHSLEVIEKSSSFQSALDKVKSEYANRYEWNFENEEETEFLEVISRRFK